MKKETGDPDFVFEISCDQMCGQGHYKMRGTIVVESQEEFDFWMAKQKPKFYLAFPDKDPNNIKKDSTDKLAAMMPQQKN